MRPDDIAIVGVPRTGKTTLAHDLAAVTGHVVVSSDDYLRGRVDWKGVPERVIESLTELPTICEGVQVARMFSRGYQPGRLIYLAGEPQERWVKWLPERVQNAIDVEMFEDVWIHRGPEYLSVTDALLRWVGLDF